MLDQAVDLLHICAKHCACQAQFQFGSVHLQVADLLADLLGDIKLRQSSTLQPKPCLCIFKLGSAHKGIHIDKALP